MIYFDAAATTLQKPPQVKKALLYAMDHYASPGRGGHRPAMLASDAVSAGRSWQRFLRQSRRTSSSP